MIILFVIEVIFYIGRCTHLCDLPRLKVLINFAHAKSFISFTKNTQKPKLLVLSVNISLVRPKEWCKRPSYFHYIGFLLDDSHGITFNFRETCKRDRLTQISKENFLGQCYTTVVCTENERILILIPLS